MLAFQLAAEAGAGRNGKRQQAEDEGERGHQDRALTRGVDGGVQQAGAATMLPLGEFDDEDGVLCREADGRQQADLEVDVVRQAAQRGGGDGAEDAEGHHEDDRGRNRQAFVEGGEADEDDQQREGMEHRRRLPERRSSKERPVRSMATPGGRRCAISSIAAMAAPVVWPGAGVPRISTEGRPL